MRPHLHLCSIYGKACVLVSVGHLPAGFSLLQSVGCMALRRVDAPWGTETNPVEVTSSFTERIVGVPDPADDSIIWSVNMSLMYRLRTHCLPHVDLLMVAVRMSLESQVHLRG